MYRLIFLDAILQNIHNNQTKILKTLTTFSVFFETIYGKSSGLFASKKLCNYFLFKFRKFKKRLRISCIK